MALIMVVLFDDEVRNTDTYAGVEIQLRAQQGPLVLSSMRNWIYESTLHISDYRKSEKPRVVCCYSELSSFGGVIFNGLGYFP